MTSMTRAGLATGLVLGTGMAPSWAQVVPLPPPPAFRPVPTLSFGDFAVGGQLSLGVTASSNAKGDPGEEYGTLGTAGLSLSAASTWDRHSLSGQVALQEQVTLDSDDVESTARSGSLAGRVDVGGSWSLNARAEITESIVGTTDPDQLIGNVNGVTRVSAVAVGPSRRTDAGDVLLTVRYQETRNITKVTTANASAVSASDRDEIDVVSRYSRNTEGGTRYVDAGLALISYPNAGFDRDSQGVLLGAGFTQAVGTATFSGYLAGIYQEFDAASIGTHLGVIGNLGAEWALGEDTDIGIKVSRVFDDQNVGPTSAGVYLSNAALAVQHELGDSLYVRGEVGASLFELENDGLASSAISFSGRIAWKATDRLVVPLDVRLLRQRAEDDDFRSLGFDQYTLGIGGVYQF